MSCPEERTLGTSSLTEGCEDRSVVKIVALRPRASIDFLVSWLLSSRCWRCQSYENRRRVCGFSLEREECLLLLLLEQET